MKQTSAKKMVKVQATKFKWPHQRYLQISFHYEIQSKIHITVDLTF